MAVTLYHYTSTPEPAGSLDGFANRDTVGDYVLGTLRRAVDEGLLAGEDGGRLDPAGTATRAEAAALPMCFAEKDA